MFQQVELVPNEADEISWKLTNHREFTTVSAYKAQFLDSIKTNYVSLIWKNWAPHKCKNFAWLIIQNRVWASNRLAAHGWRHNAHCPLCRHATETSAHLLTDCRYTQKI